VTTQPPATTPHDAPTTHVHLTIGEGCGHPILVVQVPGAYQGQYHIPREALAAIRDRAQALITQLDARDVLGTVAPQS